VRLDLTEAQVASVADRGGVLLIFGPFVTGGWKAGVRHGGTTWNCVQPAKGGVRTSGGLHIVVRGET